MDIPERGIVVVLLRDDEPEVTVRRWDLVCSGVRLGGERGRRGAPLGLTMVRRWCAKNRTNDLDLQLGVAIEFQSSDPDTGMVKC